MPLAALDLSWISREVAMDLIVSHSFLVKLEGFPSGMFLVSMFFLLGVLCSCLDLGIFLFAFLAVFLSMTWRVWEGTKVPLLVQWAQTVMTLVVGTAVLPKRVTCLVGFLALGWGCLAALAEVEICFSG